MAVLLFERDNCVADAASVCIRVVRFEDAPPLTTVVDVPPEAGTDVVVPDDGAVVVVVEATAAL